MEMTDEVRSIVERVEKLMRLAGKNQNEHEAAAAMAKAQELLAAYNLDMATVEQHSGGKTKRVDEKRTGGLYKYQRSLWGALAELNFCFYWNQYVWDPNKKSKYKNRWTGERRNSGGYRFEHRLVGRQVNVVMTQHMADYLEQIIERLTRERVTEGTNYYTNWAVSFREGLADRIIEKVYMRRRQMLHEENRKAQEAAMKARQEGREGVSTATALTLSTVKQQEEAANYDFLYGDGAYASLLEARARKAEAKRLADEEYTRWAEANPEEAKREEEKARKARRRSSWNAGMGNKPDRRDSGGYYAGYDAGERVSIDPQASSAKVAGVLK